MCILVVQELHELMYDAEYQLCKEHWKEQDL